jgi:acetyl/propionyl-CoA carboxylase alpha subunit
MPTKRHADLSGSSISKFNLCKNFLKNISTDYDPESCLKMMRAVCESRNKALQGREKALKKCHIGGTYYKRDVRYDISQFMRYIKRKLGGKITSEYATRPMSSTATSRRNTFVS